MRFGRCKDCKNFRFLTEHSKIGNHQPPYDYICRPCHDKRDGMNPPKPKIHRKFQRGTKRVHKKGWRKKR